MVIAFLAGSSAAVRQSYSNAYDDLPTFYWATHLAFDDRVSAYQQHYLQQLGQLLGRKIYPFLYPPPSLLVFSPFLLGDYEHIKVVFTLCNLMLWWLLTWIMYRLYCFYTGAKSHFVASLLIPLWSLVFIPILDTFRTGQINLFVLIFAMPIFFQSPRYGQQLFNGFLLAIAIVLKVYLILVLPVLIILNQQNVLLSTLGTLVILCVLSFFLLPGGVWLDWLILGHDFGGYAKQLPYVMTIPWNQSINGFFIRQFLDERILSGTTHWHWLIYITSGTLFVATLHTVFKGLRHHSDGVPIAIALVLLLSILIAPLTWLHHFVFAMPAIVSCFALLVRMKSGRSQKIMMVAAVILTTIISFPFLVNDFFPTLAALKIVNKVLPLEANLVMSAQLLAGMGFLGLFCGLILRKGIEQPPAQLDTGQ